MTAIKYKKVSEVCEIIMGQSPSSDTYNDRKEGLPFFQGKADFGKLYPTPKTYCSAPLKIANENDILMSVRAPVGDVNIANTKCCIGRGLAAIRANNDMINYKYLFYALNYKKNEIESMGTGSTFKAISKKDIESIKIPVSDIENQVKIVKALDKAQELIDKRKAQIEALDQLTQSVFLEMFGDPVSNPKSWDVKKLKDIAEIEDGDRGENYPKQHELVNEGILFLSTSNFVNNKLDLSKVTYITKEKFSKLRKGKLRRGDLIVTLRGSIGNIVIFDEEGYDTGFINAQMAILRLKNVNRIFFQQLYTSNSFQLVLKKTQTGSSQPQLPLKNLKELEIIIPPLELQEAFAATIQKINLKKELLLKSQVEIQNMFNSLMQRTFKGELFND
ncbi:restriction endonuclease subunit S [Bacillus smithii]|uniref:restriction endonuclease subunit S n=1 Tax=Bacillus smithii TaxID=1479 RepID=UPI003D1E74BD